MKLFKAISAISMIYFSILINIYVQDEGRKAALMGGAMSLVFFILSSVLSANEDNKKDNNNLPN
jgi:hypothetical protein